MATFLYLPDLQFQMLLYIILRYHKLTQHTTLPSPLSYTLAWGGLCRVEMGGNFNLLKFSTKLIQKRQHISEKKEEKAVTDHSREV